MQLILTAILYNEIINEKRKITYVIYLSFREGEKRDKKKKDTKVPKNKIKFESNFKIKLNYSSLCNILCNATSHARKIKIFYSLVAIRCVPCRQ